MNKLTLIALTAAFALSATGLLHSQAQGVPKTPLQQLQDIKTKNQQQIDKQAALLQKLEELDKNAQQLRIMGRRN
jgi:uncharacterized protein HemX